ncbi:nuclear transport factor 2 family protein [Sulfitobacter sp. G21635-S1]|uniref:YybH family protein n=1 Tax=Sulfitobacter sp. G21635-S1 TaxID=3014043 RepID=UPI0022AEED22|nr:nuclear transport factor 2 family protein [Sulfitobacter sp. G21635-S1]MCZ4257060.1 nuclear transport factor 2 family protein [Sulfitobacter sp. G21635-S1]
MLNSIRNGCREVPSDVPGPRATDEAAAEGVTRARFLRLLGAGFLASGAGLSANDLFAQTTGDTAPVTELEKVYDAWQERFNAGDLEGLVALYAEDVTYINPDGATLHGKAATRGDYEGLLALKPRIEIGNRIHVLHQDIALSTNHWTLELTDPEGKVQNLTGGGIEVLRDYGAAGWQFIIDDASRSAS